MGSCTGWSNYNGLRGGAIYFLLFTVHDVGSNGIVPKYLTAVATVRRIVQFAIDDDDGEYGEDDCFGDRICSRCFWVYWGLF